jgi:hypothetical protein
MAAMQKLLRVWLLMLIALLPSAATSENIPADPRVPLGDLLEILIERRDLLLFGTQGRQLSTRLENGEVVNWQGSRGAVAIVITNRRLLAAGSGSASWQETRYLRGEAPPIQAILGDRVALVATSQRAICLGSNGSVVEYRLGPQEKLLAVRADGNVAIAVTDRKLLGFSPFLGGFFEADFQVTERIENIALVPNLARVTTDRRHLVFRADTGTWSETRRAIGAS